MLPGVAISLSSGHISIVPNMQNNGELRPRLCVLIWPISEERHAGEPVPDFEDTILQ